MNLHGVQSEIQEKIQEPSTFYTKVLIIGMVLQKIQDNYEHTCDPSWEKQGSSPWFPAESVLLESSIKPSLGKPAGLTEDSRTTDFQLGICMQGLPRLGLIEDSKTTDSAGHQGGGTLLFA